MIEHSAHRLLLGSTAPPEIEATIEGSRIALPLGFKEQRRIVVVNQLPDTTKIDSMHEKDGFPKVFLHETVYEGTRLSPPEVAEHIVIEGDHDLKPDIQIFAIGVDSNVPTQPVVKEPDQGYSSALEKMHGTKSANDADQHPVDYDYVVGIADTQVVHTITDPVDGSSAQVYQDTGFVAVETREGKKSLAHSAGVTNRPEEVTGELYSRTNLLITPIATALSQVVIEDNTR